MRVYSWTPRACSKRRLQQTVSAKRGQPMLQGIEHCIAQTILCICVCVCLFVCKQTKQSLVCVVIGATQNRATNRNATLEAHHLHRIAAVHQEWEVHVVVLHCSSCSLWENHQLVSSSSLAKWHNKKAALRGYIVPRVVGNPKQRNLNGLDHCWVCRRGRLVKQNERKRTSAKSLAKK